MTGICQGKLSNIAVYFDFDDDAKHDRFWTIELESVRQYFIELVTSTGAFHHYNPLVTEELAYHNEPLDLSLAHDWDTEGRPHHIYLPYSRLTLAWNSAFGRWEYEGSSSSSYSLNSHDSHKETHDNPLSSDGPDQGAKTEDGTT